MITQHIAHCNRDTFLGPPGTPPDEAEVDVMFKSVGDWYPGDGWHTFVVTRGAPAAAPIPPATPAAPTTAGPSFEYHAGYMAGTH
jgi:hypothetical protein